jgi:hypothetical protein
LLILLLLEFVVSWRYRHLNRLLNPTKDAYISAVKLTALSAVKVIALSNAKGIALYNSQNDRVLNMNQQEDGDRTNSIFLAN